MLCLILSACVHSIESTALKSEEPSDIPDVAQLKMRVKQLYEAEIKSDWHTWYNITVHSLKKGFPKELQFDYEKFKKDWDASKEYMEEMKFKMISFGIKNIKLGNIKEDESYADVKDVYKYYAVIEMDIVGQYNSNKPEKINNQTDYWLYIDNVWYWSYRGFPND